MDKTKETVKTDQPAVVDTPVKKDLPAGVEDHEEKIAALEAEKTRLLEENANWKVAALKYKRESKQADDSDEDEDSKIRRITQETLANSRLAEINREMEVTMKKALRENKELKLAQANRGTAIPTAVGTHTEGIQVQDTSVTPEQLEAFKKKGWSDKDIERYKKNLSRYGGR